MPRSVNTGSYINCKFSFIKICQTFFQSGCTILNSTSNLGVAQFLLSLVRVCVITDFKMRPSHRCAVVSSVVFVCISLLANDGKHPF